MPGANPDSLRGFSIDGVLAIDEAAWALEDDGDADNGVKGGDFLILQGGEQVGIYLTTDSYPKETSWKVFQEDHTHDEENHRSL